MIVKHYTIIAHHMSWPGLRGLGVKTNAKKQHSKHFHSARAPKRKPRKQRLIVNRDTRACSQATGKLTRFTVVALHSGLDEVDDTVADWEASRLAGGFLGARRRSRRSCLAETTKAISLIIFIHFLLITCYFQKIYLKN